MNVRYFNHLGIDRFRRAVIAFQRDEISVEGVAELARDPQLSERLVPAANFDVKLAPSKKELAKTVADAFQDAGYLDLPLEPTSRNIGIWAWLASANFAAVRGRPSPGSVELYVLQRDNFRNRWYRHRIAGPTRIYWLFRDDPSDANLLLSGVAYQHSDDMEQFASRSYTALNRPVLAAANRLYFNQRGYRRKPGRQDREKPGTIRHYISVIQQLDLTYDLQAMSPDQILDLLPPEFDRWKT